MALPYSLTQVRPKQIGLVVLQADETVEQDMRRLLPRNLEFLVTRIASDTQVSSASLRAMETRLSGAAALFPHGAELSAVGYGCTSAAAEIGADRVAALVQKGVETPSVTEPMSALIAACAYLGITRLGLISPYVANVSDKLRDALTQAGIAVTAFASFEEPLEENVVRIAPDAIIAAALDMDAQTDCDAIFLSCTNLRTLDVIAGIEEQIGKPVLSSNQVLAWHLCQLAGVPMHHNDLGRLCH